MAPVRGRSSVAATQPQEGPAVLPIYQHPVYPLNEKGQQALRNLPRNHRLDPLKERLKVANQRLSQAAADINDRLQANIEVNERRKARLADQNPENDEGDPEGDHAIREMKKGTNEMTVQLEAKVRQAIDVGEEIKRVENILKELDSNVTASRGATQSTLGASQFRANRALGNGEDDLVEDSTVHEDVNEDASLQAGVQPRSALKTFKENLDDRRSTYNALSMTDRYACHNDYIGYRKMVHDAQYPSEEAPPLPHPSTWFSSNMQGTHRPESEQPNSQVGSDDDVAVARERISVKCPITLTEMKDPVSSTKCPHNFERSAILDMISLSTERVGGDGRRDRGVQAMRCPQPGCDVTLTAGDLQTNPVLVRKIKRLQMNLAMGSRDEGERDIDDMEDQASEPAGRGQKRPVIGTLSSSPGGPLPSRVKNERRSLAASTRRQTSLVPDTQFEADENESEGQMTDSDDEE